MIVSNELEALSVATEMEKRAIRIYERALAVVKDEQVRDGIRRLLGDERRHLQRFAEMREEKLEQAMREKLLIESVASEVLFPGGVMEMERAGSLTSLEALYRFAAESEMEAVRRYTEFADKCEHEAVREAFMAVAREESSHYAALSAMPDGVV